MTSHRMKLLFELSKEHPMLPTAEIRGILESIGCDYRLLESNKDILLVEITDPQRDIISLLKERTALSHVIDRYITTTSPDLQAARKAAYEHPIEEPGTVAVRSYNKTSMDSTSLVKAVADVYTKNHAVDLRNPDIEVRIILPGTDTAYLTTRIATIDRSSYEMRKAQYRPFFSPISLHPRIARALVNLTQIRPSQTLLDPFCGTGGLLIEAGLIGAKVIGSDLEEHIAEGCKKNLEHYGIKDMSVFPSDISDVPLHVKEKIDTIATDLPYGKSTTTRGEDITELYHRAFTIFDKILASEGYAIIGLSQEDHVRLGEEYLTLIDCYAFRAHKSLTRYFALYQHR